MRTMLLISAFLVIGCSSSPKQEAPPTPQVKQLQTQVGTWLVTWVADPAPVPLNQPFALVVSVNSALPDGPSVQQVSLSVDGRMPHHRHGMNRVPEITQIRPGEFRVENMLFHMPGRWELYFDLSYEGMTERAQDVVVLE